MSAAQWHEPEILGGDTPFYAASDAPFLYPPEVNLKHKVTRFVKDGVDHTRLIQSGLLGVAWNFFRDKEGEHHREFMRGMIAGANTDMRALGISPLFSMQEVERIAASFKRSGH